MKTVKVVKFACRTGSQTNSLIKICRLLKAKGLISNNEKLVKDASNFEAVHQEKWHELISATALRNIREAKWNIPSVMPFTLRVKTTQKFGRNWQKCVSFSSSFSIVAGSERWHLCLYLHSYRETLLFHMMISTGHFLNWRKNFADTLLGLLSEESLNTQSPFFSLQKC